MQELPGQQAAAAASTQNSSSVKRSRQRLKTPPKHSQPHYKHMSAPPVLIHLKQVLLIKV